MSFIHMLNFGFSDFYCPHCKQGFNIIEWNTVNNKPEDCTKIIECPTCEGKFEVKAQTYVEVYVTCEKVSDVGKI